MIDHVGAQGGWGSCIECTGNIRMVELAKGFIIPMVIHHDADCPLNEGRREDATKE